MEEETKRRVFQENLDDSELLPKIPNNRSGRRERERSLKTTAKNLLK